MEIINFAKAPEGSKHIAEIEVYHNKTYYRRIRVMVSVKGFYFINLPVFGIDDGKGGKKWIQFWEFSRSDDEEFKRKVLEELQPYLNPAQQAPKTATTYQSDQQPDMGPCPF